MTTTAVEPKTHELKCWPVFFEPLFTGTKTFECRKNDRGFRAGDTLWLREWDPHNTQKHYTGREIEMKVTYILGEDVAFVGLNPPYCVMALSRVAAPITEAETDSALARALGTVRVSYGGVIVYDRNGCTMTVADLLDEIERLRPFEQIVKSEAPTVSRTGYDTFVAGLEKGRQLAQKAVESI